MHGLELHHESGFRFKNVVVLVARQSGKSTLSQILALWFMYVYGFDLVLGTAQDLDTAEEVWQGAVDLVTEVDLEDSPVRPDLFELYKRTVMVNGKKSLELTTGARYKAKAAGRRSGRGLSGDLVLLDELREHQSWDAWGAITKTTMARDEAMVWALSNAGDSLSVVLTYLRKMAHAAIGDPDGINGGSNPADLIVAEVDVEDLEINQDDDSLGIFEWSAPPGCDIWDRDGWAQANPSLGYKISERTVASAAKTDPDGIFRTEVLCQWVQNVTPSAIDPEAWGVLSDPSVAYGQSPVYAVATSPDRTWTALAAAWRRPDGRAHVVLLDYKPGTDWVAAAVAERRASRAGRVHVDTASRGLVLGAEEPSGQVQAQAHNALWDAVAAAQITNGGESAMSVAVRASRWKPQGDTRVLDRKGTADISPIVAASLAAREVLAAKPHYAVGSF